MSQTSSKVYSWLRSWKSFFLVLAFIVLPTGFLIGFNLQERLNLWIRELFFRVHYARFELPDLAKEIVVVGMDDRALKELGVSWPVPRKIIAHALEKINNDGPRFVILDYSIVGPSNFGAEDDEALVEAIRSVPKIILPVTYSATGDLLLPIKPYRDAVTGVGSVVHPVKQDGKVHDFPLIELDEKGQILLFSITTFGAFRFQGIDLRKVRYEKHQLILPDGEVIRLGPQRTLPVFFYGKARDFQHVSFADFFGSHQPGVSFKDKIVIVGHESPLFHDIHATPLGLLPGIVLEANEVLTLLERRIVRQVGFKGNLVIWIFLSLGVMGLVWRRSILWGALLSLCIMTVFYGTAFTLFLKGFWFDFFTPAWVMTLSYFGVSLSRYFALVLEGERIKRLAITDSLTGLLTFRYFRFQLENRFEQSRKAGQDLGLVIFDLDFFRNINEEQGREFGDELLRRFSSLLRDEAGLKGVLGRYGGEEFIAFFKGQSIQETRDWADKIRQWVSSNPGLKGEVKVPWTVSAGLASRLSSNAQKAADLIPFAEAALIRAKQAGRDQVCVYEPGRDPARTSLQEVVAISGVASKSELGYLAVDLEERNKELKDMAEQLQKAYSEKMKTEKLAVAGELTARFSHEIKNPLANIKGCLEFLVERFPKDSEDFEFLTMMDQEVNRMSKLSLQMLRFFKPQEEPMASCSINELVNEIVEISKKKFDQENVNLELELGPDFPEIRVAPDQMKQVFLNMMMNALDAMRGQGGSLKIQTTRVGRYLRIRFQDTGPGVSPENRERLFQAFFTTKKEGIGLGLSISYNIVKRHHGILELDPSYEKGAAFNIKLPI